MRFRRLQIGLPTCIQALDCFFFSVFVAVFLAVSYRHFITDADDSYRCGALLDGGRWLEPRGRTQFALPFINWQPPGCMMHEYKAEDISTCLESRRMVFVGDSTIRNVFWATAKKLDAKVADDEKRRAEKHADLSFIRADVALEFIWDPFLNSSKLQHHLASHRSTWNSEKKQTDVDIGAALLLIGGGLWHAKHMDDAALETFKASIENVMSAIALGGSRALNTMATSRSKNILVIAPVQSPLLYPSLEAESKLSPGRIDPLNDYLQEISTYKGAPVARSYSLMTRVQEAAFKEDGIHVIDDVARQKSDVLLNMRCNAELTRLRGYPMDKTCCNCYPKPKLVQVAILVMPLVIFLLIMLLSISDSTRLKFLPSIKILRAMLVLALVLCYSFYADRTQIFTKSQKQYYPMEFKALCLITLALGILSLRRTVTIPQNSLHSLSKKISDQPFLSRAQTDEWKGWMQFGILIYHYTGSSKKLEIYRVIRILVASYLFMTGFGHTVFFYKKGDFSLRRCASVLIRLNMLSCLLPFIMNTDYLFYYFAPLITFWYLVVYLTMRAGRSRNSSVSFLVSKVLISAVLTTILIRTPGLFEKIFLILERTCRIHWDVKEWRFRLQLDSYIVYVGMFCGIFFVRITSILRGERSENEARHQFIRNYWPQIRLSAIATSLIVLFIFWHLAGRSPSKFIYNSWVPYVSWFPILSYIILRNFSRIARNFHSSVFSGLGRQSLETFALQFHIWLAADTKGLLALGVFGRKASHIDGRWADFALLTVIFFWVSWHVAAATGTITTWIVDTSEMEGEVGAKLELPRTKSRVEIKGYVKEGTDEKDVIMTSGGLGRLVKSDLRVRLAVLLGVLWILNVTY